MIWFSVKPLPSIMRVKTQIIRRVVKNRASRTETVRVHVVLISTPSNNDPSQSRKRVRIRGEAVTVVKMNRIRVIKTRRVQPGTKAKSDRKVSTWFKNSNTKTSWETRPTFSTSSPARVFGSDHSGPGHHCWSPCSNC